MSDASATLARRRAYGLLGALLIRGLDAARLESVRALPGLAEALAEPVDLDELAAEHHALLAHELPPFAGVFLDAEGLVGRGVPAAVVREAHAVVGIDCPDDPGPDHLGQALQLMAVLADAQLDALEHGATEDARTLEGWQRRVLDRALLPWMPPLHAALAGQPPSLWTRVIEMAIGVLAQHRAQDSSLPLDPGPAEPSRDSPDDLLDDPKTGLRTIAQLLTTPVRCGMVLTHRDLGRLARACELPRGFGTRRDTLEKLLRAAAEYDAMPRLVEQLQVLRLAHAQRYAELGSEPGLAVHAVAWQRRLERTGALLARLHEASASAG